MCACACVCVCVCVCEREREREKEERESVFLVLMWEMILQFLNKQTNAKKKKGFGVFVL